MQYFDAIHHGVRRLLKILNCIWVENADSGTEPKQPKFSWAQLL